MRKEIIASGKDLQAAINNAKEALGVDPLSDISDEIIDLGSKGIFGIIGAKPTKVKAYIELPDPTPERKRKDAPKAHGERRDNNKRHGKNDKRKQRQSDIEAAVEKIKKEEGENKTVKTAAIPEAELTFEERNVEAGIDMSFDFVSKLISNLGINASAHLYACSDGTRRITIDGDDAGMLIGHHGDTLISLQYLANLASTRKNSEGVRDHSRVTVDIEGYRAKREDTLRALARKKAAQALKNNRSVMLEPMTPYERRIIHSEIQSIEGVATNSIGSDSNRKIVIYLTDKKKSSSAEAKSDDSDVNE
jgi:spoIIIJ-associated protein